MRLSVAKPASLNRDTFEHVTPLQNELSQGIKFRVILVTYKIAFKLKET